MQVKQFDSTSPSVRSTNVESRLPSITAGTLLLRSVGDSISASGDYIFGNNVLCHLPKPGVYVSVIMAVDNVMDARWLRVIAKLRRITHWRKSLIVISENATC